MGRNGGRNDNEVEEVTKPCICSDGLRQPWRGEVPLGFQGRQAVLSPPPPLACRGGPGGSIQTLALG